MFKIGSQRLTWVEVKWTGLADDGTEIENAIEVQVELVDRSRLQEQIAAEAAAEGVTTDAFAKEITKDWKGVGDADGNPLGFTPDKFTLLLEQPGFLIAFGRAYATAWRGQGKVRAGNSNASPAAGGAEPKAGRTPKEA